MTGNHVAHGIRRLASGVVAAMVVAGMPSVSHAEQSPEMTDGVVFECQVKGTPGESVILVVTAENPTNDYVTINGLGARAAIYQFNGIGGTSFSNLVVASSSRRAPLSTIPPHAKIEIALGAVRLPARPNQGGTPNPRPVFYGAEIVVDYAPPITIAVVPPPSGRRIITTLYTQFSAVRKPAPGPGDDIFDPILGR